MSNSTVFTVGSALRQAENDDAPVGVLVDGHWFAGTIAGLDGDGVLLDAEDGEVLVRLTAISVVRKLRKGAQEASAAGHSTIAPVLSITRDEPEAPVDDAEATQPTEVTEVTEVTDPVAVERVPSVAEQLAARAEDPSGVEPVEVESIEPETVEPETVEPETVEPDPVAADDPVHDLADDLVVAEAEAILAETDTATETVDADEGDEEPPALSEEDAALLQFLPDDLTDDERFALIRRRALQAQQAAAAGADPAAIVAQLTGTAPEAEVPATPAEITAEDNPLVHSSTQTDDWRAMLVSLRQQAADTPPSAEPEKRRSWRLAR